MILYFFHILCLSQVRFVNQKISESKPMQMYR